MTKHFFFTTRLDYKSGWGTNTINYLREFKKNNIVVICNKKNFKHNYKQYEILHQPLEYLKNPFLIFIDYLKLLKILRKYQNHNLYSHFLVEPYSLILPLVKNFFISNIFYAIGTYSLELQSNIKTRYIYYFARKSFDKVIFLSSFSKFNIENKVNFNSTKNKIIINPIIYLKKKSNLKSNKFKNKTILSVGEIKPRKGYHLLIEVLNIINNKFKKNYDLIIIGKSSNQNYIIKLKNTVKKYKLEKNVKFQTNVNERKIQNFFIKSNIFVLLSKKIGNFFEGFGIVYLEALHYGLPIIVSKESGAKDLSRINKKILVVKPDNLNFISKKIIEIISANKKNYMKLGNIILKNHFQFNKNKFKNLFCKLK
mgnify:CR=1 FL=1